MRLKHIAQLLGGGTPSKENEAFWSNGSVPWVSPKDMKRRVIVETEDCITEEAVANSATSYVEPGSPLLVVRSGILRHTLPVAIAGRRLTINQDMKAFRLSDRVMSRFLVYWIEGQSSELLLEWRQFGATVESIDIGRMMNGRIALPALVIQQAIADFLDRETARIDQLIEKKEAFLSLVEEKKAALRARIVNGASSDRPRDGGVGWFGVLPEDWPVRRGKVLFRERQDRSITGSEELLTVSHLTGVTKRSDKDVNMFLAESMEGYKLVSRGDVVINTMWAWMGAMGVSPLDGLTSPSYGVYEPVGKQYDHAYLDLLLRSHPFVAEVNRRSKGIYSSRLRLYPEAFLDIAFPVPPMQEQQEALRALSAATTREEALSSLSQGSLERLREYRSALITAAVTGQIDLAAWGKTGETDRRLEAIERALEAEPAEAAV